MSKYIPQSHVTLSTLVIITETNAFRMTKPSPTRAKIVSSVEGITIHFHFIIGSSIRFKMLLA
jgi:hypothetical protein